jgi:endonuclease/exonuclease/phosphatase (EEP) superfamily protein YafD
MRPSLRKFATTKLSAADLIITAGLAICVFSLTGLVGENFWIFDLTSHFRLQYAVLLSGLACGLFLSGILQRKPNRSQGVSRKAVLSTGSANAVMAIIFAAFGLLNWLFISQQLWGKKHHLDIDGAALRVMLMNVRTENSDTAAAIRAIAEHDPDLVVIEEIDERWWTALSNSLAYPFHVNEPREDNFGIALLSKHPLEDASITYLGTAEVPSVMARFQVHGRSLTVFGTHPLPPGSAEGTRLRNEQLNAVGELAQKTAGTKIFLGDLNTTQWNHAFEKLIEKTGFVDASRGFGYQGTWPSFLWPMRIHLDHCLISPDLSVVGFKTTDAIGSDHLPIVVDLVIPNASH